MSLPRMSFSIDLPEMLVNSPRLHNQLLKRVMRVVIEHHWRHRIPGHFRAGAARKYGHRPRSTNYIRQKIRKYGTGVDLVASGRTRQVMTSQARISVGGQGVDTSGQATAKGVTATLRLRFPFPGGTGRFRAKGSRQQVTIEQMIAEIGAVSADEVREITRQIDDAYQVLIDTDTSARQRVKKTI